ncbi:MAG TPA: hypothetical protein VEA60_14165 [Allosphingosinicella sp.]|nr:hypothetical protein [Allosphingosinicella sp.]
MREADSLVSLAEDLRALNGRERRAVLAALSPFERAQVAALLDAAATPAPLEPAAPDYSRFSPWLARHLGAESGAGNLTAATRQLLTQAAGELAGGRPAPAAALEPAARRRSLTDAVAQLLSPRWRAR